MATMQISKVKIGMELIEPVLNFQGRNLFNAGDIITEKHLKAFKAWGITEVEIKRDADVKTNEMNENSIYEIDEKLRKDVEQETSFLFQLTDKEDPVIKELVRLTVKNKLISKKRQMNG